MLSEDFYGVEGVEKCFVEYSGYRQGACRMLTDLLSAKFAHTCLRSSV